jgi:hypothetical protein
MDWDRFRFGDTTGSLSVYTVRKGTPDFIHGRRVFSRREEFARSVAALTEVKSALWELCFPGTEEDSTSNLQTLYETAQLQRRAKISELLSPMLAVDADTIPEWYAAIFSLPWHKCYTLNIDDLDAAVSRAFDYIAISSRFPQKKRHGR